MKRTYRYRLYPDRNSEEILSGTLETCRQIYNTALEQKRMLWKDRRKKISYTEQAAQMKEACENDAFLSVVHSQVRQDVLRRVDKSMNNFFRRVSSGREKPGFPRFKSRDRYRSFIYPQSGFKILPCSNPKHAKLKLSKVGSVSMRFHRPLPEEARVKTCTLEKKNGKWFACFSLELPDHTPKVDFKEPVGIDVGLNSFAVTDTGERFENPRFFRAGEKRLAKAQKSLSKKQKGSSNRRKQQAFVGRCHEKVFNQRRDFLHKLSKEITDKYDFVAVEDLQIKNMVKNRRLSKSIADASWGTFVSFLTYKAESAGGQVVKADPKHTSQVCSFCGERVPKTLSVRTHSCPFCGLELDRDENAAVNILERGRRAGTARSQARGEPGDFAFSGAWVTGSAKREAPSFREG